MGAASRATATHHTVWHHTRTPLHLTSSTTKFDSHSVWQVAFAVWWFVMRKKNPTQVEVVDPIQVRPPPSLVVSSLALSPPSLVVCSAFFSLLFSRCPPSSPSPPSPLLLCCLSRLLSAAGRGGTIWLLT
mmetsp:Transcript_34172/g.73723  ORF Transcript_34172/g.73723 Transcript_34172/m.73723 type:complete len:130 (+) Transcript_34172:935-1324(+)